MTILIVEDTARLARVILRGLAEEGLAAEIAASRAEASARLDRNDIDAVILDLGLPDGDGLDVLRQARAKGHGAPVLVLTARDAIAARVEALDLGADDYLVKPFAFDELLARVRALLRRARAPRWAPLACGDLALDPDEPAARLGSARVPLSPRERSLLELLLRRRGEVVPRAEILRDVFGYRVDPGTNLVDVHIAHLRRKLADCGAKIETVRGVGFRLLPEPAHA